MSWTNPNAPNLTDYTTFVQDSMGISTTYLPSNSPWLGYAFNQGMARTVFIPCVTPIEYVLAVYNCAGHLQIEITPDQTGQNYFQTLRGNGAGGFGLVSPISGVVSASSDEGTSQTLAVPQALQNLTIADLQFTKTPWGRSWLAYGQDFGSAWGVT